jgi:transposase
VKHAKLEELPTCQRCGDTLEHLGYNTAGGIDHRCPSCRDIVTARLRGCPECDAGSHKKY